LSLGTYQNPKIPMAIPVTQVQIHHREPTGRLSRTTSSTTSAMAHPAVTTPKTTRSFASSGGGGSGLVRLTLPGYSGWLRTARERDVLSSTPPAGYEGSPKMTPTQTRTDAGLATALRISVSRLARRLRAQRAASGMTEAMLSETQLAALSALEVHHAMTPGELAEHEKVQPPSMTRVIAVLEDRDLVFRSPHPTDRRQVILTVTEEGRAMVQRVRRRKDAWLAQRLSELSAAERATLRAAMPILEKLSQS
jgi:DNA-binding MarR family transcriptional regulator